MSETPSFTPESIPSPESQIPKSEQEPGNKLESQPEPAEKDAETDRQKWEKDIRATLEQHKLFYDQDLWDRRIHDGRYLRLNVVEFDENEAENRQLLKERFFKAPMQTDNQAENETTNNFFIRQVLVQEYLDQHTDFPVTEILDANTNPENGPLYSVVNWYQKGEGVGFLYSIEDNKALTAEHAPLTIKSIRDLHHQEGKLTNEVRDVLDRKEAYADFAGFRANIEMILSRQVSGTEADFSSDKHVFGELIAKKLDTTDLAQKIDQLLEQTRPVIERHQGQGEHIVHGDYSPNNVFLGDGLASDKFIGLDFEWAGYSQNEILASIYDYGNMRARAWNNPDFQAALDREMVASYTAQGQPEEGKVIVALGTLRSSLNLSSYFENIPENFEYPEEKDRRIGTERDILPAFQVLNPTKTN